MKVALQIVNKVDVSYADGSKVSWDDFLVDEPAFIMPKGAERAEYVPNERLSLFLDGHQFGDDSVADKNTGSLWPDGDRFIARKDEYIANAIARVPPPPVPLPENTKTAEAKIAIDNYLVDPQADEKVKAVLTAIRATL